MPQFIDDTEAAYSEMFKVACSGIEWKVPPLSFNQFNESNSSEIIDKIQARLNKFKLQVEHLQVPEITKLLEEVDPNIRYELIRTIKEYIKNHIVENLLFINYEKK